MHTDECSSLCHDETCYATNYVTIVAIVERSTNNSIDVEARIASELYY